MRPGVTFMDITTVGFIGFLLHVSLGVVLLLTFLTRRTYPGFKCWTASQFCWVFASAAFFLRPWLGEPLSVLLSNPLFIACGLLIRNGMARFYGYSGDGAWFRAAWAVSVMSVGVSYWFQFVDNNVNVRIVAHSLALAFLISCSALEPLFRVRRRASIQPLVSASLLLVAACLLARVWLALESPVYTDLLSQDAMLKPSLLAALFGMVMAVFGFIALTHERMERELGEAKAELERLANSDELTGLANRRGIAQTARHDIRLARRYGHPVSFIIFDLDRFKDVNDTHGHAIGDRVLAATAACCQEALRDTDTLARWGGEEFAIIMPETGLEEAVSTASRLHALLREFTPVDGLDVRTTASFGVALLGDESFEELAARADQALYRAKREGRDRVCVAG